ncbi:MAG: fimbria/pilus periplasmic chaperone [Hydrogenophilales bacterium]|nr:fimbria/pilus periplasmic chaperone [Hydrogenophilales bacterium]
MGLKLAPGHDRAAITVTNQGVEGVVMQVETVSWTQADGSDHYAPTRELLVNPPLFTLKPGHVQVLRIGLRQPPSGERESAFRLLLREVPPAGSTRVGSNGGGQGKVRVLLQIRLPVYVEPAKVIRDQQWQIQRSNDGAFTVVVTNTGTVHMVISELTLRAADAAINSPALASIKASTAVFPGQRGSWVLHPQTDVEGLHFTLDVATDQGPQNVALDLGRP